jgi:hypothetical protein
MLNQLIQQTLITYYWVKNFSVLIVFYNFATLNLESVGFCISWLPYKGQW